MLHSSAREATMAGRGFVSPAAALTGGPAHGTLRARSTPRRAE